MFKQNKEADQQLDRIGTAVLRSAAADEEDIERAAATPFLFTRVRAAIAEEQSRSEDTGGWLSLLFVARRAIPAMALVALFAGILTVWSAQVNPPAGWNRLDDEALADTRDPGIEQTILANSLSQDEILSIVVDRNEREQR